MIKANTNINHQFLSVCIDYIDKKKLYQKKKMFSPDEDEKLKYLVEMHGNTNWELISNEMQNRNSRQCKERWFNYLSPTIEKSKWTKEEDDLLEKYYLEYGPKWKNIAQMIEGRTEINVRNRFNLLKRHKNKIKRKSTENNMSIDDLNQQNSFIEDNENEYFFTK